MAKITHVGLSGMKTNVLKGNSCFMNLPTREIAQKLPLASMYLAGHIKISLSKSLAGDERVISRYKVRREKVKEALNWLKQNNPHYFDVLIDNDALSTLPLNHVPMSILHLLNDSNDFTDSFPIGQELRTDFHSTGLSENVLVLTKENVANNILERYLHIKSQGYVNDWDSNVFCKAFPWLFQYGKHAPSVKSNPAARHELEN